MPRDLIPSLNVVGQTHPLHRPDLFAERRAGDTVAEIVASVDWDDRWGPPVVILRRAGHEWEIARSLWHVVRPNEGTDVYLGVRVQGPVIGAVASALIPAAASWAAGTVFGLAAGTLGYTLVVAGISIIAGLAINALIPPPEQPEFDSPERSDVFFISGIRNRANPYGAWPKVYGRHRMFPDKMATGYSETINSNEGYFRGRMTFGYGPVALENLRIGTTEISQFQDVELEFRNVDEAKTLAMQGSLAPLVKAWHTGAATMELYPQDITEDTYNVQLDTGAGNGVPGPEAVRTTRPGTTEASIDITWPGGLGKIDGGDQAGDFKTLFMTLRFWWRESPGGAWQFHAERDFEEATRDPTRRIERIVFPEAGTYDIRVQVVNLNDNDDYTSLLRDTFLTAIRSISPADTTGDPDVAEVAFRIRASEQLSGELDNLNAIVHGLVPSWSESGGWTAPDYNRHPAWIYLDAIRGNHLPAADRIPDEEIDLPAFAAWAGSEPHWTCDTVVRGDKRVADVLDLIAASGRARRALVDFRQSIVRDVDQPVRHIFGPRNSWGFRGQITFPKEIHGFRVLVRSEDAEWQEDEIVVYADGYDASTATELETLRLPGTVLTSDDTDQSNAYRLAVYHLNAAKLRRETYEWNADWESFLLTRGDRVQVVHDVPVVGVGQARVTAKDGAVLTLDEDFGVSGAHALKVVESDSTITALTASGAGRDWTVSSGDASGVAVGDKVVVFETDAEILDLRITGIYPDTDGSARITAVADAPGVRGADSGTIPDYVPVVGTVPGLSGPAAPVILEAYSDERSTDRDKAGVVYPRVVMYFAPRVTQETGGQFLQIRWRKAPGAEWQLGPFLPVDALYAHTGRLVEGETYDVQARTIDAEGRSQGWVTPTESPLLASIAAPIADVVAFTATATSREVRLAWEWEKLPEQDLAGFVIRLDSTGPATWEGGTEVARPGKDARSLALPPVAGTYFIKAFGNDGGESVNALSAVVTPEQVAFQESDFGTALQEAFENSSFADLLGDYDFAEAEIADVIAAAQEAISRATLVNTEQIEDTADQLRVDHDELDSVVVGLAGDLASAQITLGTKVDADGAVSAINAAVSAEYPSIEGMATALAQAETDLIAKVDSAGAISAVESEVSATYGSLTAWASATQLAKATRDELLSGYIWRVNGGSMNLVSVSDVDSNGVASAPTVTAEIEADYVRLTGFTQIDTAVVEDLAASTAFLDALFVDTAQINNAAVETLKIAGNAVTVPVYAEGSQISGTGSFRGAVSAFIGGIVDPLVVYDILVIWNFKHGYTTGVEQQWGYQVLFNGVVQEERDGMIFGNDYPTGMHLIETIQGGLGEVPSVQIKWKGANSDLTCRGRVVLIAVQR